jgi:hypothetical protein
MKRSFSRLASSPAGTLKLLTTSAAGEGGRNERSRSKTHDSGSCGIPVVDPVHVRIVLADGIKLTVGRIELDFVSGERRAPEFQASTGNGIFPGRNVAGAVCAGARCIYRMSGAISNTGHTATVSTYVRWLTSLGLA